MVHATVLGHALPRVGDKRPSGPTDPAPDPEIFQKPGSPTRQDTILKDRSRVPTSSTMSTPGGAAIMATERQIKST
jgi:hypothetical protein